jgi:hypothetical protein
LKALAVFLCSALAVTPSLAGAETIADHYHWTPFYATGRPAAESREQLDFEQKAGKALPTWSSSIKSPLDGRTYPFTIVGTNPQTNPVTTQLSYLPIALVVKFPGGVTLDPRKPGCGDTLPVDTRFFQGPNFVPVPLTSNGVNVGPAQVNDGDMRAEFWTYANGTKYSVHLKPAAKLRVITVNAPAGSQTVGGVCSGSSHDIGEIDINAYDSLVQSIDKQYATPNEIPLILTYNVFETEGGCCILGYHSTYPAKGRDASLLGRRLQRPRYLQRADRRHPCVDA